MMGARFCDVLAVKEPDFHLIRRHRVVHHVHERDHDLLQPRRVARLDALRTVRRAIARAGDGATSGRAR
jgi:hypothetical protein